MNFHEIESLFRFNRNNVFLRTKGDRVTYSDFLTAIDELSKQISFCEGRLVGIISPTGGLCLRNFIVMFFSLLKVNAKIAVFSPKDPLTKLKEKMESIRCDYIIFVSDDLPYVDELNSISIKEIQIACPGSTDLRIADLDCVFVGKIHNEITDDVHLNEVVVIISTSGSGGKPKNVVLSLENLFTNALYSNRNIKFHDSDVWLLSLPVFHVSGLSILFRAVVGGAGIFLPSSNNAFLSNEFPQEITHISLVSTLLWRIINSNNTSLHQRMKMLKAILLGGGPIPQALVKRSYELGWNLYTTYGMTEMASQITTTVEGDTLEHLLTSGKPLVVNSIKLGDDGSIKVNGPTRFIGYLDGGMLRKPFDNDGWFETGDIGRWTQDGYLCVLGRKDNMFICGGENIFPEEIETCILESGYARNAVVIPRQDEEYGMVPIAYVELVKENAENQLIEYLRKCLPGIKIPKRIYPLPKEFCLSNVKLSRHLLMEYLNRNKEK